MSALGCEAESTQGMNQFSSILMLLILMVGIIVIVALFVRRSRNQTGSRSHEQLYALAVQAARDREQLAAQISAVEQRVAAIQRLLEDVE
ncbi:hypothetical protein [Sciscionella sediminilitoris]|uniref:hypothetical protein n=1 Tax=Sciscionella sediminilitoris TaxID=1445613 RepID=UPI0004DEF9DC|nr:hypothetical protein [Sciscionella sp. SE31]